jgi:hypothetical protein
MCNGKSQVCVLVWWPEEQDIVSPSTHIERGVDSKYEKEKSRGVPVGGEEEVRGGGGGGGARRT